jgi:tRNA (guanine26-N2/guanine27-N2)-dimethyltransferase
MREKFDFIDIDPFGSPITYVYQTIPRLAKDGILAVTATDTAALFGVFPMTCFRKYGSFSLKTPFSHELAIRILAKAVIEIAAKQNISLNPIFAHATLHYYRIYFQASRSYVEKVLKDIGFIYYCSKCKNRFATKEHREKCKCKNKLSFAGPLYLGNLWDSKLVAKMLKLDKKHEKFLKTLLAESKVPVPFYYESSEFKKEKKIAEMIAEIKKKGFKASRTHFSGKGIRTNVWDRRIP